MSTNTPEWKTILRIIRKSGMSRPTAIRCVRALRFDRIRFD